jgi:hypothetical protein
MRWHRHCWWRGGRRRIGNEAYGPRFDEPRAPGDSGDEGESTLGSRPGNKTNAVASLVGGGSSMAYAETEPTAYESMNQEHWEEKGIKAGSPRLEMESEEERGRRSTVRGGRRSSAKSGVAECE